jgi:dienelactone hydrolase
MSAPARRPPPRSSPRGRWTSRAFRPALRLAIAALAIGFAFAAGTRTILDRVPKAPDRGARYLIFLHGRIVEEQGRRPTSPTLGVYEYDRILEALAGRGEVVISEQRPAQTDVDRFAAHVADQVHGLEKAGVPPERITVAGFSKGGSIAIRASVLLADPRVNFVFLAACGNGDFNGLDLKVAGRILSIYEANDDIGRSCADLFTKAGLPSDRHQEIEVHIGDAHGTFYRVHSEWLDPLLRWAETAPIPGRAKGSAAGQAGR